MPPRCDGLVRSAAWLLLQCHPKSRVPRQPLTTCQHQFIPSFPTAQPLCPLHPIQHRPPLPPFPNAMAAQGSSKGSSEPLLSSSWLFSRLIPGVIYSSSAPGSRGCAGKQLTPAPRDAEGQRAGDTGILTLPGQHSELQRGSIPNNP